MTWGFIWLMFLLKIPILMLFGVVYWAVRSIDEPAPPEVVPVKPHPHRDPPRRRRPRGPHGDPAAMPSPPRVRGAWQTAARGRPLRDI